jgi:hypothetical protein
VKIGYLAGKEVEVCSQQNLFVLDKNNLVTKLLSGVAESASGSTLRAHMLKGQTDKPLPVFLD